MCSTFASIREETAENRSIHKRVLCVKIITGLVTVISRLNKLIEVVPSLGLERWREGRSEGFIYSREKGRMTWSVTRGPFFIFILFFGEEDNLAEAGEFTCHHCSALSAVKYLYPVSVVSLCGRLAC